MRLSANSSILLYSTYSARAYTTPDTPRHSPALHNTPIITPNNNTNNNINNNNKIHNDRPTTNARIASDQDSDFPANDHSLGDFGDKFESVEWARASHLKDEVESMSMTKKERERPTKLFNSVIRPSDVIQTLNSSRWLIQAITSMAEFPGAIESLFTQQEATKDCKYEITVYEPEVVKQVAPRLMLLKNEPKEDFLDFALYERTKDEAKRVITVSALCRG